MNEVVRLFLGSALITAAFVLMVAPFVGLARAWRQRRRTQRADDAAETDWQAVRNRHRAAIDVYSDGRMLRVCGAEGVGEVIVTHELPGVETYGGGGGVGLTSDTRPGERLYLARMGASARDELNRAKALIKADALLRAWLSPAQLKDYDEHRSFCAIGGATKRRYVITPSFINNVYLMDDATRTALAVYCFGPRLEPGGMPLPDHMLAQKIALESNEKETLCIANLTAFTQPPVADISLWSAA